MMMEITEYLVRDAAGRWRIGRPGAIKDIPAGEPEDARIRLAWFDQEGAFIIWDGENDVQELPQ